MSATILDELAVAAKTAIDAAAITSLGNTLKVYSYDLREMDTLPALVISGPTDFSRVQPDEAESQLGTYDWRLTYESILSVQLDDPEQASTEARSILGQIVAAIDADETLGGACLSAHLSDGSLEYAENDNGKQLLIYRCSLRIWALVA